MSLSPHTDPSSSNPEPVRWRLIFEDLHGKIRSGELIDGAKLPSEHELCRTHGVSRITVRRALRELESLGVIRRRQGASSEVVSPQRQVSSRLVHVLMATEGHILADLHHVLVSELASRDLSHCSWTPDMLDRTGGLAQVAAMPARGVLMIPFSSSLGRYEREAAQLGRCVTIGIEARTASGSSGVCIDYATPCHDLLSRAARAGIRSVLHVTFLWKSVHRDGIAQIFSAACLDSGQHLTTAAIFQAGVEAEMAEIRSAISALARPALVFCATDYLAMTVQRAIAGVGPMPPDLILAGLFNTPWSQAGNFTSIDCRLNDVAARAVDLLLAPDAPTHQQAIAGELIVRDARLSSA